MVDHLADARRVAEVVAGELVAAGARAVVLVGSVARGDARPESDIDLVALGDGPAGRLSVRGWRQVSVSWRTAEEVRAAFRRPADAGGVVPAWCGAVPLADPHGEAAALTAEALAWDWRLVDAAADAWVAEQVTGWAEEVHRLVGQSDGGGARAAAVQRGLLAVHLAAILAVHHRLRYDSENRIWDLVADREGPQWTAAQDVALGVVPATAAEMSAAALRLYALAVRRTADLLDANQAAVVRLALEVAGNPLGRW